MSIGVNLMFNLTKQLTKTLPDDANVEILDTHHKLKKDTPSGTSLSLGEEVKSGKKMEKISNLNSEDKVKIKTEKKKEIGFSSIRGGDVIGDHSVFFFRRRKN